MKIKAASLLVSFLLLSNSGTLLAATPIKQNAKCATLGQKVNDIQGRFQCIKSGKRLVWKKISSAPSSTLTAQSPLTYVPNFVAIYSNNAPGDYPNRLTLAAYDVPPKIITSQKIDAFEFSVRKESATEWSVPLRANIGDSLVVSTGQTIWSAYWNLLPTALGANIYSRVRAVSGTLAGEWSPTKLTGTISATPGTQVSVPTQTPSPATIPTPVTTPSTVTPEVGCSVNYLSPLPYSSQRIALTSITWEKDSQGYVNALATLRNDNSMNLRLVEFKFYVTHKFSVVHLDQTLQGNSFFIKDDPKFNSVDGLPGAWTPGQSRTFRLPSNQMLDCRSLTVLSSGFSVTQGIGE